MLAPSILIVKVYERWETGKHSPARDLLTSVAVRTARGHLRTTSEIQNVGTTAAMGIIRACLPFRWPLVIRLSNSFRRFSKLKSLNQMRTRWGSYEHKWPSASKAMSRRSGRKLHGLSPLQFRATMQLWAWNIRSRLARSSEEPTCMVRGTHGHACLGGANDV